MRALHSRRRQDLACSAKHQTMQPSSQRRLTRGWRAYAALAFLTIAAALPGLFAMPPLDRDESRFAQATAQMLETGDFVRIRFQDEARHKKPVGIHWLQAASVSLVSSPEARAIWAYRAPSLLGALVCVLATFWAGRRLVGESAAFVGAGALALTVLLATEAMIAKTDAMLAGATALAMAGLANLHASGAPRRSALLVWFGLAVGVLIKGPITPLVVGLSALALAAWERRARWLAPLAWWPGPVLAALLVLPWIVAVQIATDGEFLRQALGQDLAPKLAGGHEGHGAPPGVHALLMLLLFWPATLLAPGAIGRVVHAVRAPARAPETAGLRLLICWFAPIWLVFEALPTKLAHYPLPAYPALALLAGAGLVAAGPGLRWLGAGLMALTTVLLAGLTLAPPGLMAAVNMALAQAEAGVTAAALPEDVVLIGWSGAIAVGLGAFLAIVGQRRRAALGVLGGLALAGIAWNAAVKGVMIPAVAELQVTRQVARSLTALGLNPVSAPDAPPVIVYGFSEPSLVFALGGRVILAEQDAGAAAGKPLGPSTRLFNVRDARARADLAAFLERADRAACPVAAAPQVAGLNYSDGAFAAFQILAVGRCGA
jgi:4-amino-4-deoxy-L-arabinose transferase-like glycosyltransferase